MYNINWKVRFMNKTWVVTFVAAVFVLIGALGKPFGFEMDLTSLQEDVVEIVYAIFGILALLGVVVDGTTEGAFDSEKALEYTAPGVNEDEFDGTVEDDYSYEELEEEVDDEEEEEIEK